MKKKFEIAVLTALLAAPLAAQAQGIPGGMERGAAEGNAAAGPVGGIVGGAVGGAVGGVNGVLGINPGPRYHRHWMHEHARLIPIRAPPAIITDGALGHFRRLRQRLRAAWHGSAFRPSDAV